jgi:hypothetical protein
MPLIDVPVPEPRGPLPPRVRKVIAEAERRVPEVMRQETPAGFICSEFDRVGAAIQGIRDAGLAAGDVFCEWGSGLGAAALVAACLGFHAHGIEIDPLLADEAAALAADLGLDDVEFACGTFVPPGGEDLTDVPLEFGWLSAGGACGHDLLGLDPAELDLVFAYPWPGEEGVIEGIFERFAGDGALLLTYHGIEGLRLRRKVAAEV